MERFKLKVMIEGDTQKPDELKSEIEELIVHLNDTFVTMAHLELVQGLVVDIEADAYETTEGTPFSEEAAALDEISAYELYNQIVELFNVQKELLEQETIVFEEKEYARGQYNGMESIVAMLENREPEYKKPE